MKKPQLLTSLLSRLAVLAACLLVAAPTALAGPRIVSREAVPDETTEEVVEEAAPQESVEVEPAASGDEGTETTVVVVSRDRPSPRAPSRAQPAAYAYDPRGFEVGMRVGTFTAGDDWIDADGTANYGGFGMALRWRFVDSWSFELGVDSVFRGTDTSSVSEDRSVVNFGALTYFGEPGWGQSYMSFGVMASDVELWGDNTEPSFYGEGGLYAGLGADIYFDNWRLNSELRVAGLGRNEEDTLIDPLSDEEYIRHAPDGRIAAQWFVSMLYSF